jgi:hypothetical protein
MPRQYKSSTQSEAPSPSTTNAAADAPAIHTGRIVDYTKRPKIAVERTFAWFDYCERKYGGASKLIVVMDIDDTLLLDEFGKGEEFITHIPSGHAIFIECRRRGIDVHLVTAREGDDHSRKFVRDQLRSLGYDGYRTLYMVNARYKNQPNAAVFKGKSRHAIANETGKQIILNVGDKLHDMYPLYNQYIDEIKRMACRSTYYFIEVDDDASLLSLKLPSSKKVFAD